MMINGSFFFYFLRLVLLFEIFVQVFFMCFVVYLSVFCSDYFFGYILIVFVLDDFSFVLVVGFVKRVEIFFFVCCGFVMLCFFIVFMIYRCVYFFFFSYVQSMSRINF